MANTRQIDHVVIAVRDLDRLVAQYRALGFTVTPRGHHDWGTMNNLVQFPAENFVELLAIEDAGRIPAHAFDTSPPRFSFGAHNRDYLLDAEGMSMLVLSGNDSVADVATFAARGLQTYAPFDFSRRAQQPDGSEVEVAFSLAFVSHPDAPQVGLFTCHNRYPHHFYRAAYQSHANGATGLVEVVACAPKPESFARCLGDFSGGAITPLGAGYRVDCGPHSLVVTTAQDIADRYAGARVTRSDEINLVGYVAEGPRLTPGLTPADDAGGAFIVYRQTA